MMWVLLAALIGGAWYGLTIYLDHWYLINIETEEAIEGFAILLYSWPILMFVFLLSMLFFTLGVQGP